jgi:hypothetical protein
MPSCDQFLSADELDWPALTFPLHLRVCEECLLLQIPPLIASEAESLAVDVTRMGGIVGNNVLSKVADPAGFIRALREQLGDDGWLAIEVRHALNLVTQGQFDSIDHGRYQYFTLISAVRALATAGLAVVDVELISDLGGSIRLWARPDKSAGLPSARVADVLRVERAAGLHRVDGYMALRSRAQALRHALLRFLLDCHAEGKRVIGYGAPAQGATLLNYCGIRSDLLAYTVDPDPRSHGRFMPGTRVPIYEPAQIANDRPDVVLALPWNLEAELTEELGYIADWGGQLVFPLPTLHSASLKLARTRRPSS